MKKILPFEKSYWVIPGKILAGAYPSSVDKNVRYDMLNGLKEVGIKMCINLTEEGEKNGNGIELFDYGYEFRNAGLEIHRRPIKDVSVPTQEEMQDILDLIDESLSMDKLRFCQ